MEFSNNGISVILNKDLGESDEIFFNRGQFIISQTRLNNLDELNKLSKIWANSKFKGCKYSNSLSYQIKEMEKNMK